MHPLLQNLRRLVFPPGALYEGVRDQAKPLNTRPGFYIFQWLCFEYITSRPSIRAV